MPPFTIQRAPRRVAEAALPGVRQGVSATGALGRDVAGAVTQLGRQIEQTGAGIAERDEAEEAAAQKVAAARAKAGAELQERRDKVSAQDKFLEYNNRSRVYNQENLSAKGEASFGMTKRATEWHTKTKDEILASAGSVREKQLINEMLNPEFTKQLNKYSAEEAKQLDIAELSANDSMYDSAVIDAGQPDSNTVDLVDAEIRAIDALNAKYKGFDEHTKKKAISTGMSEYHSAVVNGKLVGNLAFAKEYFKKNEKLILPKEREIVRAAIRTEDIDQTSQRIASEISLKVEDNNEWNNAVDKKTQDVEIQDAAKSILDAKKKDETQHDKELVQREFADGLNNVLNANTLENGLAAANSIKNPEDRLKAIKVAEALQKFKTKDVITDNKVLTKIYTGIGAGTYNSLEMLRGDTIGKLSKSDQSDIETFWKEGGLLAGVSEEAIRKAFKTYAGFSADDIPVTYQNARRVIIANVKALPSGRTSVNFTEIDGWMSNAVRGQADAGNLPQVETISRSAEQEDIITLMEDGNEARVKKGLAPYPINPQTIAQATENVRNRGRRKVVEAPTVIVPPTPFEGETPQTASQIKGSLSERGQEISTEASRELEKQQFETPEQRLGTAPETGKQTFIKALQKEQTLTEAKDIFKLPDDSTLPKFDQFVLNQVEQLESEGFNFDGISSEKFAKRMKELYQELIKESK